MLTSKQKNILKKTDMELRDLDNQILANIAERKVEASSLTDEQLDNFLRIANALYRKGAGLISDMDYDMVFLAEMQHRNSDYIDPGDEPTDVTEKTVKLPVLMLSTDKAYVHRDIDLWEGRLRKAAKEIGKDFEEVIFKVTPKLDGFAAYDDGKMLYTRGNGIRGTDITRAFERGLTVANGGERGLGAGEIVVSKTYFAEHLSSYFDNARNFQASVIKEKAIAEHVQKAIREKAAVFHPFSMLPAWKGRWNVLSEKFDEIKQQVWTSVDYDVDGIVIEATDEELKKHMGHTMHHYCWQIACKENLYKAETKVLTIDCQTTRTGQVNPVAVVEPTFLSGATIQRAFAHHYGNVRGEGIGPGAVIEIVRSGEVIPKIERVLIPAEPIIPEKCPSCGSVLVWEKDFLYCKNSLECPAQTTSAMEHFFKELGNIDGFASATIKKLYEHGIKSVDQIYALTVQDFVKMGFGPQQSENMAAQLARSRSEQIEDWRFLSALGVPELGPGNCQRLLAVHKLEDIFDLKTNDIAQINRFGVKIADVVVEGFKRVRPIFEKIYSLGFNLERTTRITAEGGVREPQSPFTSKLLVFTGTMEHGERTEMEKEAINMGAKVGQSVTGKTDILVIGKKPSSSKLKDSEKKGVRVMTEEEYLKLSGK